MPSASTSKSSRIDDLLANASTALNVANDFGAVLPIPLVATLISSAQVIVQTAQSVRQNRGNCADLADRVARLAQLIREQVHGKNELVDDRLQSALEELDRTFKEIKHFVLEQDKASLFQRLAKRSSIESEVRRFTGELDFSLRMFQTGSHLRGELRLMEMAKNSYVQTDQLIAMNARANSERKYHDDGQFRVYRLSDVRLMRKLTFLPEPDMTASSSPPPLAAGRSKSSDEFFVAEIKGRAAVVVKKKMVVPTNQVPPAGIANLSILRKSFHPNVVQLEGYSDNTEEQFYVVKGRLQPLPVFLARLPFMDRGIHILRSLIGVDRGYKYLRNFSVQAGTHIEDLMVDTESYNVVMGANGEFQPFDKVTAGMRPWTIIPESDEFQHQVVRGFARGAAMSYKEMIALWATFAGSVYVASCKHINCLSPIKRLYLHNGLVLVNKQFGNYEFVEFMEPSHPAPIDWPPILYEKTNQSASPWSQSQRFNEETIIQSDLHNIWFDDGHASRHLLEHALRISKEKGVQMTDVYTVHHHSFIFQARRTYNSQSDADVPPVYFHVNPLEDGQIPVPWGYFSFDAEPSVDCKDISMQAEFRYYQTDYYVSTLRGVDASVWVAVDYDYCVLTDLQAEFAKFLQQAFQSIQHAETTTAAGRITELVQTI